MDEEIELKRLVEGALRDRLGRDGIDVRDADVVVDQARGGVRLRRRAIGIEIPRKDDLDHGTHRVSCLLRVYMARDRVYRGVDRFVSLALALRAREEAIAPFLGAEGEPPAWSVAVEPMARRILETTGRIGPGLLAPLLVMGQRIGGEHGLAVGGREARTQTAAEAGRGWSTGTARCWLNRGALTLERATIGEVGGAETALVYEGGAQPSLSIECARLPDALLAALSGRRPDDAASHPATDGSGAAVSSARNQNGNVVMNLRRARVPLAPAPEGIDTPWMAEIARA